MAGTYFLTLILPKIVGEPTRKSLIDIHWLISGNLVSTVSKLGGGRNGHLALTMNTEDYLYQTAHMFVPPHNPGDLPLQLMGTAQDQALGTERFQQNQALFWRCNAVDGGIKKKIIVAVQQVFLSPIMGQLIGFGQVTSLHMLQNIFRSYGAIDKINLEENAVNMMGPYDPA